jgi:uncharacterized membrane-anchored protein YhcB (DUF1043 family)
MEYVKTHWGAVAIGIVIGIVFASQIKKLPLVSKIPTA